MCSSDLSVYIGADGKRILIDAGLSEKKLSQRMAHIDRSLNGLDAVFATHEHTDHIRGMGPLLRRHQLPLYTTEGTYKRACHSLGKLPGFNPIRAGQFVEFGELVVEPYATPHDAEESVAFVIHYRGLRLDRKSTRLNSSHKPISYAVFCLKKKKHKPPPPPHHAHCQIVTSHCSA